MLACTRFVLVALACLFIPYAHATLDLTWSVIKNRGTLTPPGVEGTILEYVNRKMVLFGGAQECTVKNFDPQTNLTTCGNEFFNTTWAFSFDAGGDSGVWNIIDPSGQARPQFESLRRVVHRMNFTRVTPGKRSFHRAASYRPSKKTDVIGGVTFDSVDDNAPFVFVPDFWEFDASTNTWTKLADPPVGARIDSGFATREGTPEMYLFAGLALDSQGFGLRNDVWMYNSLTRVWTLRSAHNATDTRKPHPNYQCRWDYNENLDAFVAYLGDTIPDNDVNGGETWIWFVGNNSWVKKSDPRGHTLYTGISATWANVHMVAFGEIRSPGPCTDPETGKGDNPTSAHYIGKLDDPRLVYRVVEPTINTYPNMMAGYTRNGLTLYRCGGKNVWCRANGAVVAGQASTGFEQLIDWDGNLYALDLPRSL